MNGMQLSGRREGFALPMAILLVGFLTAGLVASYTRQSSERLALDSMGSQTNAFAVADAGLNAYMAAGTTTDLDTTYTFPKGNAHVTATLIRAAATSVDTEIWLIRSVGTALGGSARNPAARRIVAQLAMKPPSAMQVLSGWTSLSGIDKNGNSGAIDGQDACGVDSDKAGAAMPNGTHSGKTGPFSGDPDIKFMGTPTQMADSVKIDWANIVDPGVDAMAADIIVCKTGTSGYNAAWSPCGTFPTTFASDYWPTIIINGSSSLPADGQGTLIVTGNLTLNGGDLWDGIILVGGIITDNGNGGISGAVVSGLNVKLGQSVPQSSKANGTKRYEYNSCDVASATQARRKLNAVQNAWMDTWNSW